MLTKKEALVILGLNRLPGKKRNMYGVAAITGMATGTAYANLRVLEAKGVVQKQTTVSKKTIFNPTIEAIDEADTFFIDREVPLNVL